MEKEYIKYQHLERFGKDDVEGIENGECYIFPKLDGTNGKIWFEDGKIKVGSRNKELSENDDNYGFYKWVHSTDEGKRFYRFYEDEKNRDFVLYGEFLVKQTKQYKDTAYREFYVFDVVYSCIDGIRYLGPWEYTNLLDYYSINSVPLIQTIENPTQEELLEIAKSYEAKFLLKDKENDFAEGIVIKRYDYINKYGRTQWAKIVLDEYKKEKQIKQEEGSEIPIEEKIVNKYITKALVDKEFSKIVTNWDIFYSSASPTKSELIPKLLGTIYYCLMHEEIWNILKEYKNPTINFKMLKKYCDLAVKQIRSDLF